MATPLNSLKRNGSHSNGSEGVQDALTRVCTSPEFVQAERMRQLLEYLVRAKLEGRAEGLKQTVIAVDVFGREPDYDPKVDAIVRTEARRLRLKLAEYYANTGSSDPLQIQLPKSSYVPLFVPTIAPRPEPEGRSTFPVRTMAGIAAIAAVCAAIWFARRDPAPLPLPRLLTDSVTKARKPVLSPGGDKVAWSADEGGYSHIQIHDLKTRSTRDITTGNTLDYYPTWSPDGKQVAYQRKLDQVRTEIRINNLERGSDRFLATVTTVDSVDWSPDGLWIATSDQATSAAPAHIVLISVANGMRRTFGGGPLNAAGDRTPRFSPDGGRLAFTRSYGANVQDLHVIDDWKHDGAEARRLTSDNREIAGFSWTADGSELIVSVTRAETPRSLWRIPVDGGEPQRVVLSALKPRYPDVARVGNRMVFLSTFTDTNIWRFPLSPATAADREIANSNELDTSPNISPDGKLVAFRSVRTGFDEIWVSNIDGSGPRKITNSVGPLTGSPRWSPSGTEILYDSRSNGHADIYKVAVTGLATARITTARTNEILPSWSRDGQWIYYASDATGRWQLWRQKADGSSSPQQITREGGYSSMESHDGQDIYYSKGPAEDGLWRMPVTGGDEQLVIRDLARNLWGQWALGRKRIYYVRSVRPSGYELVALDKASGESKVLRTLTNHPVLYDGGLAVNDDETAVFHSRVDRAGSDVYVVEKFR